MMWRFFRLGVKHNSCTGNQTHFRIIGSTCANADCDDVEDINKYDDKNFKPICDKENFASAASKHFHKKLQSQENSVLKLNEKRKDAYKKFGVKKAILQESSQNHCGNTHKNEVRVKSYSNSDAKLEANINLSINDDENIVFGSLAENTRKTDFLPDDPDEKGILEPRHIAQTYGRIILEFCKERKLKEALNVLEVEMKNKDVAPNCYCFNILINACGKMGYTKKAFDLYYQMKKRGVYVEKFAYTGLFNACANSPFKPEGLKLATTLRKQIIQNEILLHPVSYHAMIKAFGYCGDIKTAFEIVDEMILKDHEVTTETLSFLLHACISDKETGFRHALMVWRKFRILLIEPNIYSYNLLLRCTKECKAGDTQLLSELLDELKDSSKVKGKLKKIRDKKWANLKRFSPATYKAITQSGKPPALEGEKGDSFSKPKEIESKEIIEPFCQIGDNNKIVKVDLQPNMELELVSPEKVTSQKNEELVLPNVLSYNIEPGNILAISSLDKKEDRMWLLGGVSGILRSMKEDGVKPTVVTCVHILESLPSTLEVEEALLASMENLRIKPDVIFCNKLIQKRCMRKSLQEAKEVLTLMQKYNVPMDLITFGCLAIGCQRPSEIRQLLRDMKNSSVVPSEEIMETLILNSVKRAEYGLAIELLGRMKRLEVPVTEDLLSILERTRSKIKTNLVEIESESADTEVTPRQRRIRDEMKLYLMEYKHFLKTSRVEFKEHPWAQFGHTERPNKVVKKDAV